MKILYGIAMAIIGLQAIIAGLWCACWLWDKAFEAMLPAADSSRNPCARENE